MYTPIAAASRRLTDDELEGFGLFLTSGKSVSDFAADHNLNMDDVNKALRETGISAPEQGVSLTDSERDLYLDVYRSGQNLWQASNTFGFDANAALSGLQQTGLRVPLNNEQRYVYDEAFGLGLTQQQTATALGLNNDQLGIALGGAGLRLPGALPGGTGRTSQVPNTTRGASNPTNPFNLIPQAPGRKLGATGFGFFSDDPNWRGARGNILTSGRGVTGKANTRRNTLSGTA